MIKYIFVVSENPYCQKCCFVEDSIAQCNVNIAKAKKDCGVDCLSTTGYYAFVNEEDINKER